jgi:hypothetical protein
MMPGPDATDKPATAELPASATAASLGELATTIRVADQGVAQTAAYVIELALTAGDALLKAKVKIGHGNWLFYLKNQCDLSEDRAERYMRIARGRTVLEANSARMRNLSLTAALKLIERSKRASEDSRPKAGREKAPKITKAVKTGSRQLNSLAWSDASPDERARFLNTIGKPAVLAAAPPGWNLDEESEASTKPPLVSEKVLHQRAAAAERIRDLMGGDKTDIDSESASGNASDEQGRLRHFEFLNIALRSEVEELKAQVRGLEDRGLRAVPLAKLVDELEHRLPAALPKKHLAALKALRGALGGHHLGPTLNLNPVVDSEVTKH